ncbi:hypothetical protein EVAR_33665_1 [Eumeta japonica]|uniref:peptide-methionine (S)-S-oxide reductase n=1 Tax=Eumeta variegata TaxID=151549 RepID=A0A4C1VNI8_EUMVA|nr:hypothetical protein EVAR_33665_1 [Eumeta japonica]
MRTIGDGDHTEVIELDYDPKTMTYEELLDMFWANHEYGLTTKLKRQYQSLILYHDEEQRDSAENSYKAMQVRCKEPLRTEIAPAQNFYPAEEPRSLSIEALTLAELCGPSRESLYRIIPFIRYVALLAQEGRERRRKGQRLTKGLGDAECDYLGKRVHRRNSYNRRISSRRRRLRGLANETIAS